MNETFFATIAGAAVGLIGVLLTLREERKKAREEREFNAKHAALLSAVESVTRFLNYYMTLPDRNLPTDGTTPEEVTQMGIALNRLHFYCGFETIKCSINMGQVLGNAYIEILKAKIPSIFISTEIDGIDSQALHLETINKQLQQEILVLISSNSLASLLASCKNHLATNLNTLADLSTKKNNLLKQKYDAVEKCRDVIKEDFREVYDSIKDVLLMARRELNLPINEDAYATLINQSTERTFIMIETLLTEIRSQVKSKLEQL